jgi:predicted acetyltransferase
MAGMSIEIRPFADDVYAWMDAVMLPFGRPSRREDVEVFAPVVELDRSIAAYDGARVVGTTGAFSLRITVPGGGELPMAGVTMVGVHPTHRRRGILRQMMRRQLDDVRASGTEPIAGLWASEAGIYQRFGYGVATFAAHCEVDRRRAAFRSPTEPAGELRLVDVEEARSTFPMVFDAVLPTRPGVFARTDAWWTSEFFYDPEHARRGGSPASLLLHETDGRPTGYARYRISPDWDEQGPKATLEVSEAMAVSPEATLALWRYLLDVDLTTLIRGRLLPVDHPLLLSVAEPRRLAWGVGDGMWLRIVDLPRALTARSWGADGELVLELADAFCDWNAGRWQLTVRDGRAEVGRTDRPTDLALDAGDLAATYLGGVTVQSLAAAGRAHEASAGAALRADRMLLAGPTPWCPLIF